jgi:hypothetical protein
VSERASVCPWIGAQGSNVAISLYRTTAAGTPDTVPSSAVWSESYLHSTDGGTTFSPLVTADPIAAKSGPICTEGTNCSANRELGDFQSITIDNHGNADMAWARLDQRRCQHRGALHALTAQGSGLRVRRGSRAT